jgi:hypothetical protein
MDYKKFQISAQNPKVLVSLRFYRKLQFEAQSNRNYVFLGREAHIPSWLYTMVLYRNFMALKKFQTLAENAKLLAFDFTEKCQFTAKTDRNSVFLCHEANILDRLYKIICYTGCTYFRNVQILAPNPKVC